MKFLPILLLSFVSAQAAEIPDCSGPDHWPANMALVNMKNAGILTNDQVDFKKTTSKKLSYEKIGKDLYRKSTSSLLSGRITNCYRLSS